MLVEVALDVGRIDGVVVGNLELVQLGAEETAELLGPELEIAGDLSPESTLVAGPPEALDELVSAAWSVIASISDASSSRCTCAARCRRSCWRC